MNREVRFYLTFGLGFFVVLELMMILAIIWWPSFAENIDSLKSMSAPVPMLTEMITVIDQAGVDGYVVGQHYFKGCNTLGVAAAILFAMGAIAGEAHRGTMELWLARPVTRTRLMTERYFGGLAAVVVPVFLTSATAPLFLAQVGETMQFVDLMRCSLHSSIFLAVMYSVTFLCSAFGEQPQKIAFVMLFLNIFCFAIYMVKTITHYSIYRLVDIEEFVQITIGDRMQWGTDAILLGISAACFLAARQVFLRRVP